MSSESRTCSATARRRHRRSSGASITSCWYHLPPEVLRRATMAFMAAPTKGAKWFPDPGTLLEFARKDEAYIADMKALYGLDRLTKAKPTRQPTHDR